MLDLAFQYLGGFLFCDVNALGGRRDGDCVLAYFLLCGYPSVVLRVREGAVHLRRIRSSIYYQGYVIAVTSVVSTNNENIIDATSVAREEVVGVSEFECGVLCDADEDAC